MRLEQIKKEPSQWRLLLYLGGVLLETVNIKAIQLDLKKPKLTTIGDFIQNDTNIIKFTLTDNGSVIDLDVIDQILINYKKPNGEIVSRIVTSYKKLQDLLIKSPNYTKNGAFRLLQGATFYNYQ